jgi:hypothetical protein
MRYNTSSRIGGCLRQQIVLFVETPRKFITAKLSIRKPGSSSDNNNIICTFSLYIELTLKAGYSPFCASVLLITKVDYWISKLCKFRMFCIFLNINTSSYLFKSIANQNSVKFSDSS